MASGGAIVALASDEIEFLVVLLTTIMSTSEVVPAAISSSELGAGSTPLPSSVTTSSRDLLRYWKVVNWRLQHQRQPLDPCCIPQARVL